MSTTATSSAPSTGAMLRRICKERGLNTSRLAKALGRRHEAASGYLRGHSIPTANLWELCHVLQHNFFADLAAQLPAQYPCSAEVHARHQAPIKALEEKIKALEHELLLATTERDVLLKVAGGKG